MGERTWTAERLEILQAHINDDLTAQELASIVGVSRNSIIGKVLRLGMDLPRSLKEGRVPSPRKRVYSATPQRRVAPVSVPASYEGPVSLEDGQPVTALTVAAGMCRWPFGEPGSPEFHFCGRGVLRASPYCDHHHRAAYQSPVPHIQNRVIAKEGNGSP